MNERYGQDISELSLTDAFYTGPGQLLIKKLIPQLARVKAFTNLFGPYRIINNDEELSAAAQSQRWADYPRYDWSIRQLPAINIFESETETKESSNAFLSGTIDLQTFWPPKLRRSDWSRVPSVYRGAILNFFESKYVTEMLDEHVLIRRPQKVPGLNELGKNITWRTVAIELMKSEVVPLTIVNIRYRIDLRAWYRELEFDDRTKDNPFDKSLDALKDMSGEYLGIHPNPEDVQVRVPDQIVINN